MEFFKFKEMIDWNRLTKQELDKIFESTKGNADKGTGGGKLYSAYRKQGFSIEETKIKCGAKPFTITREYLQKIWCEQKGRCADSDYLIDTKYLFKPYNQHALAPSVDRIDCNKGYVEGNIRFVLRGFNKFRGTMELKEWNEFKSKLNFKF